MDDISRELPPDTTGATPVSERQKGPEEVVRFERGQVGESGGDSDDLDPNNRIADAVRTGDVLSDDEGDFVGRDGGRFLADRLRAVSGGQESGADEPVDEDREGDEQPEGDEQGASTPPEDQAEVGDADAAEATGGEDVDEEIDAEVAAAAVAAEADTASVEQDDLGDCELGEDGLPVVPELTDAAAVAQVVYVLMLTSREGMTVFRLAQACNTTQKVVEEALDLLSEKLRSLDLPVELSRVGDTVRWMSSAVAFPYLQRLRGVKKLEKLSPAALETLAVIAYQQPVMRSEIESIRGVKAGPMLRTLLQHKLVKVTGRADVPGRPLQYGTTQHFLERFGLASLQDLPSVKEWKNLG